MGLFCRAKSKFKKQKKEEEKVALQILLDFAEGKITSENFWEIYKNNDILRNILINDKMRNSILLWNLKKSKFERKYDKHLKTPSDLMFNFNPDNLMAKIDITKLQHKYELFVVVNRFLSARGIHIEKYNDDVTRFLYLQGILPNWIEVDDIEYLEKLFNSAPNELTKNEKTVWCKNRIKELFKYDDKKPDWIQSPQWPIISNTPYTFSYQETSEEGLEKYYFYNPNNKTEKIIIEQCE